MNCRFLKRISFAVLFILIIPNRMSMVAMAQDGVASQPSTPPTANQSLNRNDILNLDVEQLGRVDVTTPALNVEVTTVTKQESTVGRSSAAVFVVTQDMIRRSGCNNIPDLLRLVPGLEVARMDDHTWAITSRGFNGLYANKLLVMIDGRSIYTPIFSGVYWDNNDVPLDDIDRIEVIRGPGATVWGANAVNGVINIITKRAKDSHGAMVAYGSGTEYQGRGGARVGGQIGEDLHWRVSGQQFEQATAYNTQGLQDAWRQGRMGFRADWEPDRDKSNLFTIEGDCYQGFQNSSWLSPLPQPPYAQRFPGNSSDGGDLLARWTHIYDERSDWQLQSYFDQQQYLNPLRDQTINTFDVEFQHRFPIGERHETIWGWDYRQIHQDLVYDQFALGDFQPQRTTSLFSMFVQDEITLVEDRLSFTAGSKFERNDYSGFEFEPSGRLLFTPDKQHSFWGAVSRAVRTPAELESDGFVTSLPILDPSSPYRFIRIMNNSDLQSEQLIAYELGYRAQPNERFSYDLALFYNVYENLVGAVPSGFMVDPYGNPILLLAWTNRGRAHGYGAELSAQYKMSERWRVSGWYSYLHVGIEGPANFVVLSPNDDPPNQIRLMSSWDFSDRWRFDAILRYVDQVPFDAPAVNVPEYITMDLQLAWQPRRHLEVAVIGRNLLDNHHYEFSVNPLFPGGVTEVERSVFGKVTWRY